jgi:hypothetical protein
LKRWVAGSAGCSGKNLLLAVMLAEAAIFDQNINILSGTGCYRMTARYQPVTASRNSQLTASGPGKTASLAVCIFRRCERAGAGAKAPA